MFKRKIITSVTAKHFGKACDKHPNLNGERYADGHCLGCCADKGKMRRKKNKEQIASAYKVWSNANKDHLSTQGKIYRDANKERKAENYKRWAALNSDKLSIRKKVYQQVNAEAIKAKAKVWRKENQYKKTASENFRRATTLNATPVWADKKAIQKFYYAAKILSTSTGNQYHVDHIIPLRGKNVCGLHVETNLQILLGADNVRKSNRYTTGAEGGKP